MELIGLQLMLVLALILLLDGLNRIRKQGYSKSVYQVLGCAAFIAACFGAPYVLAGHGEPFHTLALIMSVIGGLVACSFLLFSVVCMAWSTRPLPTECDFIIVLGAGLRDGVRPTRLLAGRLKVAKALYDKLGDDVRVVVCGGMGSDERISEAEAMRSYLLELGMPEESILVENRSTTTLENLSFASVLVNRALGNDETVRAVEGARAPFGFERISAVRVVNERLSKSGGLPKVIIVTSNFHVVRTRLHALMVPGLDFVGCVGKSTQWYYLPAALIRDYLSFGSHILRLVLKRES